MNTPLYVKTDNTFLESMIKVNDIVEYAKENKISSIAIADNNMYGVLDFYLALRDNNIKPIIGLDIKYNDLSIVLYAKNYDGYKNLINIFTISTGKELDIDTLKKYSNNLICVLPYASYILKDIINFYSDIFYGYSNTIERDKLDGRKIFFNKILCLNKEDLGYLKYLYCIKNDDYIDRTNIEYRDNYIINNNVDIENNRYIVDNCNVEIPFDIKDLLPIYDTQGMDKLSYLKKLCVDGLKQKIGDKIPNIYIDRLKMELNVINDMGFCNYFLVVQDYVKYAKSIGSVALCRGSAAGSLVSYLLDITNIDPIKFNLYFERFLNKDRVTMPDIDIDFEGNIRDKVVHYCIDKYGIKKISPIITFSTMASRQAIKDICKVLDISDRASNTLTSYIDSKLSLKENLANPKLKEYLSINDELKKAYDVAMHIEGIKRQSSVHAAGVIMCNRELTDLIPLKKYKDYYITGYDNKYLEKMGLLKMDLLTVRTLDFIQDVLHDIDINYNDIPLNDNDAIKVFSDGDMLGIFQFESAGMTNTVVRMKPNSFSDIYNVIALYRPGPMQNINTYINRKLGKENINYLVKELEPILNSTYGVIVYQEQIMEIAKKLAGYTLAESDNLRRAMSKKKKEVIEKEKDHFINGCVNNGIDLNKASKIYQLMLSFASYGFNKAHSVVYGMCAYKMAYIKVHYPTIFFKHLLLRNTCDSKFLYELKKYNVTIKSPDINLSEMDYCVKNNEIIYPLSSIKGVGSLAQTIINNRGNGYDDVYSIFERIERINKENIEPLIKVGCFDSFGYNRNTLINNLDALLNYNDLAYSFGKNESLRPVIDNYEEYSNIDLLEFENTYLGLYLSSHPVSLYKGKYHSIAINDIPNYFNKNIDIVIYISRLNTNKKDLPTCFITGNDEVSSIELIMFNSIYEKNRDINKGDIVLVNAKVQKQLSEYSLIINTIKKLNS